MDDAVEDDRETVTALKRVMISYDVGEKWKKERTALNNLIFGRNVIVRVGGRKKKYHYPGLIAKSGVERWGQSVLIMREKEAEELSGFLTKRHIPFNREIVWIEG